MKRPVYIRMGRLRASWPAFVLGAAALQCATTCSGAIVAEAAKAADVRLTRAALPTQRGASSVMLAVAAAGKRVVAAGERGIVVTSDDCGSTWQQARVPSSVTLTSVFFVDDTTGWATGHAGLVLHTIDGGKTWNKQLDGNGIAGLATAAAGESVAGSSDVAKVRQRMHEAEQLLSDGADKPLFAIHFWNREQGIAVGAYGIALSTTDGGRHWRWISERIPNPRGAHLYGMSVQGESVTIVGEQGLVVQSRDGGASFTKLASPYPGSYFGVVKVSAHIDGSLVAYGLRGNAFQISGTNAGFKRISTGTQASLLSAVALDGGNAILFDANGQAARFRSEPDVVEKLGNSPVGQVASAARVCGDRLAVAGARGVAVIEPARLSKTTAFKEHP